MPMSTSTRALVATATVALLAGCSGAGSSLSTPSVSGQSISHTTGQLSKSDLLQKTLLVRPGISALNVKGQPMVRGFFKGALWVTDAGTNNVYKCSAKKCKAVGSGWSEPQGLAIDSHGNVYVADTANSRIVELSKSGAQVAILNDPGEYPAGVGVDTNGNVGVTNICNSASCGQGNIVFYTAGSTNPTSTATGLLYRYYFGGYDSAGNFYNDGEDASGIVSIGVVASGGTTDNNTGITPPTFPGGIEAYTSGTKKSHSDTLVVDDQLSYTLTSYSLPSYTQTAVTSLGGACDPVTFGLQKKDAQAVTAEACYGEANIYAFPGGGSIVGSVTGFSEPIGAGLDPTGTD